MKKLNIIDMPMKYGCFVEGANLAFDKMYNVIDKVFKNKIISKVEDDTTNPICHKHNNKIKYIDEVMNLSNKLYNKVYESHNNNLFPLTIGGDHSTAIGSISASLDYYKGDVNVIWIDAHTDIHNDLTTPSGNIHGMPLSILIGRCSDEFNIGSYKLEPNNIHYIGIRNYEKEEIDYVNENNIEYFSDLDVNKLGVKSIVEKIVSNIKDKPTHISFDLDVLSDSEFHAVNVSAENNYQSEGGIKLNDSIEILKLLLEKLNVCSMDMVEYNPTLDLNGECLNKIEKVLSVIDRGVK